MQQRYYEPIAGRFLSVDPVTTDVKTGDSFNRYVYGNNNPYKFKDPDGRAADLALDLVFIAADLVDIGKNGLNLSNGVSLAGNLVGAAIPFATGLGKVASTAVTAGKAVPDSTVVCRGGSCTSQAFANGKGVTVDSATGKLDGISTGLGDSVASASKNIPHTKVGVTTAGDIRAAGGQVVNDKGNHGTVSGLTADKAAEVFKKVVDNPNTAK
jgi:uncharacterized protein RhaS with RHS repeats